MKLIKGEFKEKLDLLLAPSIRAGFPSPAEDYLSDSLDFNRDLIKHPEATFYGRILFGSNKKTVKISRLAPFWGRFFLLTTCIFHRFFVPLSQKQ